MTMDFYAKPGLPKMPPCEREQFHAPTADQVRKAARLLRLLAECKESWSDLRPKYQEAAELLEYEADAITRVSSENLRERRKRISSLDKPPDGSAR